MQPKNFAILAGATAVSLALAAYAVVGRDVPLTAQPVSEALYPGLLDRANEVRTVRITTPEARLTLESGEQGWTLAEKGGYPVEAREVRDLVLGLANLQLVEAKTAQPERLKRLELEEPGGKEAKSHLVELLGEAGEPLAAAVIGKTKPGLYGGGRAGVYVRRAGENQAWLAAGSLEVPDDAMGLLASDVIDIPSDKVARITLGAGTDQPVVLQRPNAETEAFTVEATPPEGREVDQGKVELLAGSLASLGMQDVKKAAEVPVPAEARRSRFETFDGLAVDVTVLRQGEGDAAENWLRLAVAPVEPAAAPPQPPAEGEAAAKPAPERAAELNARVQGWTFKIAPYMADRLGGSLDTLLAEQQGAS
jgi:hypothetical protein